MYLYIPPLPIGLFWSLQENFSPLKRNTTDALNVKNKNKSELSEETFTCSLKRCNTSNELF